VLAVEGAWVVDLCLGDFVGSEFEEFRISCTQNSRSPKGASRRLYPMVIKEEGPSRGASARHSVLPGAQEKACAGESNLRG
jgi:hypothetical protein